MSHKKKYRTPHGYFAFSSTRRLAFTDQVEVRLAVTTTEVSRNGQGEEEVGAEHGSKRANLPNPKTNPKALIIQIIHTKKIDSK